MASKADAMPLPLGIGQYTPSEYRLDPDIILWRRSVYNELEGSGSDRDEDSKVTKDGMRVSEGGMA